MKLALYPDPVLLEPAEPVAEITEEVRRRTEAMIPFLELEGGIGLAAPQVSWGARVLLASEDGSQEKTQTLINPEITWKSDDQEWGEEGCLSFPGIFGEILRARRVRVRALDLDGRPFELEAADLLARILQHEVDHLDGVLFITKMRPADRLANKPRIEELVRRHRAAGRAPLRS